MPVISEFERTPKLREMGVGSRLVEFSVGRLQPELFQDVFRTPPILPYRDIAYRDGPLALLVVPVCEDNYEAGWVKCAAQLDGELTYIEYCEIPDEFHVIARSDQGFLSRMFGEVLTGIHGEAEVSLLKAAAAQLGYSYLDELIAAFGIDLLARKRPHLSGEEEILDDVTDRIDSLERERLGRSG